MQSSCASVQADSLDSQPERANAIIEAYAHAWDGYHKYAFPLDELKPLSRLGSNTRYGWGLTVFDGLDTAIIMGLIDVVEEQLDFIDKVNFSAPYPSDEEGREAHTPVSSFETNIRYLGGLLSAYDLLSIKSFSDQYPKVNRDMLLRKAQTLADKLASAFDTPSGIAAPFVDFIRERPVVKELHVPAEKHTYNTTSTACLGTFLLEFYRLSDLTGNQRYRWLADQSEDRALFPYPPPTYPGLVGATFDTDTGNMLDLAGGWESSVDSFLEYLIKAYQYSTNQITAFYKEKWLRAVESTRIHLVKHPPGFPSVTFIDTLNEDGASSGMQDNYACFAGGNLLLGCKLLDLPELCDLGVTITDGCHWVYNHTETSLGPVVWYWFNETGQNPTHAFAASDPARLESAARRGFYIEPTPVGQKSYVPYSMYMGFPETIESIFYAYRITGDRRYQDWAWEIFKAINTTCRNDVAFAGITDVDLQHGGTQYDKLDSYFFAETLKYLYLIFSDPQLVSLNHWVFNTEAHPFLIHCADD
ncbi:glycoside hydrolase family 47 protein [Polychaeton citri CBS 116435]|uniref:alpha-1,2-Mannosidase n=1 Tax=Polychaeton citri CBS 116435 TaxID=1314669 RepID=A0A9P4UMH8_9PEZI|nr:glycoside hydrolase family 47 protein [Polychaeton citri CBS 116435]